MLPRWNYAYELAAGKIGGTGIDWNRLQDGMNSEKMFELTHSRRPSRMDGELMSQIDKEFSAGKDGHVGAGFLCLASPSFQWR